MPLQKGDITYYVKQDLKLKTCLLFLLIDPSGVWMGPPDKREPKVSSSIFDQPYQSISTPSDSSMTNQILSIQNNIQKPSASNEISLVTREEDNNLTQGSAHCSPFTKICEDKNDLIISDHCNTSFCQTKVSGEGNCETPVRKVAKPSEDSSQSSYAQSRATTNAITIPERQRKAASMQYHTPKDNDILNSIDRSTFNSPRVVSCNLELLKTDDCNDALFLKPTEKPTTLNLNLTTSIYNPSKNDSKMQQSLHLAINTNSRSEVLPNEQEPDHSSLNIGNSFSVPTSPTDACASSPIYSSHDEYLYTGNYL